MSYMKVHASLFSYIHGHKCLLYAFVCMFLSYDFLSTCVMFIRLRLKETALGIYVFNTFKIESMHVHIFIIKIEVAGIMRMTF